VICLHAEKLCGYVAENGPFVIRNSCLLAPTVSQGHRPSRRTAIVTLYTHNSHSAVPRIVGSDRPNTERLTLFSQSCSFLIKPGFLRNQLNDRS
jgi:hypothetical protein